MACSPGSFSQNASFLDSGYLVCQSCSAGKYSMAAGATNCAVCGAGLYSSAGASVCSSCSNGKEASSEHTLCVTSSSASGSVVAGIFANQGTPFYIIAIVTVLCGSFGLFVSYGKQSLASELFLPSLVKVALDFTLFAVTFGSEMVLASGAVSSSSPALRGFGLLIIGSRCGLGIGPTLWLIFDVSRGKRSTYAPLMHTAHLYQSSKAYGLLMSMTLFEARLLVHFPWMQGSFIRLSGYPTLNLLRLSRGSNVLQIAAIFVGQLGILINQHDTQDSSFFAVLVLNIVFSSAKLLLSLLEIALQLNVLAGHEGRHGGTGPKSMSNGSVGVGSDLDADEAERDPEQSTRVPGNKNSSIEMQGRDQFPDTIPRLNPDMAVRSIRGSTLWSAVNPLPAISMRLTPSLSAASGRDSENACSSSAGAGADNHGTNSGNRL